MFRILGTLVLVFTSGIACGLDIINEKMTSQIDALFMPFDHDGSPGYALGVVHNGKLIYSRGYGRAELDYNMAITPNTSFHLASLSKQFVAASIALLIQEGKLSFETPLASFFPEAKKYGDTLKIKHLIYFTSGLTEYTSLKRASGMPWFSFDYFTTDEAIATSLGVPALKFEPGAQWDYSNIDYMLLAKIVEKVSGEPLRKFLQDHIFDPLGMKDSLLNDDSTMVIPNRATGYVDRKNEVIRQQLLSLGIAVQGGGGYIRLPRISPHYGGSGVFSTIQDLARWDENFYTHRLGGKKFTALMLRREKFSHAKDNDALGLVIGEHAGHKMIWFSGGDADTSTYMARFPDEHLTVICLANMLDGNAEGKAKEVIKILLP